ncbi:MAG: hypothetical protein ABI288_11350 [Ginsengibacter sp.]
MQINRIDPFDSINKDSKHFIFVAGINYTVVLNEQQKAAKIIMFHFTQLTI